MRVERLAAVLGTIATLSVVAIACGSDEGNGHGAPDGGGADASGGQTGSGGASTASTGGAFTGSGGSGNGGASGGRTGSGGAPDGSTADASTGSGDSGSGGASGGQAGSGGASDASVDGSDAGSGGSGSGGQTGNGGAPDGSTAEASTGSGGSGGSGAGGSGGVSGDSASGGGSSQGGTGGQGGSGGSVNDASAGGAGGSPDSGGTADATTCGNSVKDVGEMCCTDVDRQAFLAALPGAFVSAFPAASCQPQLTCGDPNGALGTWLRACTTKPGGACAADTGCLLRYTWGSMSITSSQPNQYTLSGKVTLAMQTPMQGKVVGIAWSCTTELTEVATAAIDFTLVDTGTELMTQLVKVTTARDSVGISGCSSLSDVPNCADAIFDSMLLEFEATLTAGFDLVHDCAY